MEQVIDPREFNSSDALLQKNLGKRRFPEYSAPGEQDALSIPLMSLKNKCCVISVSMLPRAESDSVRCLYFRFYSWRP